MKAPSHFFKCIPPAPMNSHLSIPISFRKYLVSTTENNVAILRRGIQKWTVKIGDDWVFGDGWEDFMTENDVQDMDIVVFKHEGNMVFYTMVFDTNWCEREFSNYQVTKSSRKSKLHNNEVISKVIPKAALSKPYFISNVTAYSIKRALVNVPVPFARANKLHMRKCELIVMDEKQRLWSTQLRSTGDHVRIRGPPDMWVANGLKEGDVLLFELVDNGNKPLMKLHRHGSALLKLT